MNTERSLEQMVQFSRYFGIYSRVSVLDDQVLSRFLMFLRNLFDTNEQTQISPSCERDGEGVEKRTFAFDFGGASSTSFHRSADDFFEPASPENAFNNRLELSVTRRSRLSSTI